MSLQVNIPKYGNVYIQADTFADLRTVSTLTIQDGYAAIVKGGNAIADGLGGMLTWIVGSTAADNNQTTIAPADGGPGRWVKIAVGVVGPVGPASTVPGPQGNPGGNVMSVGPFSTLSTLSIPLGTTLIQTSGLTRSLMFEDATMTDAMVSAYPSAIAKTANGRYFRIDPRNLWVEQFGAQGIGQSHDDTAAFNDAVNYAKFCDQNSSANQAGTYTLNLSVATYYLTSAINLYTTIRILGQSKGAEGGQSATTIIQGGGSHTFVVNRANTVNGSAVNSGYIGGADGSEIGNIHFIYAPGSFARGLNSGSAIWAKARVYLHDCVIESYPGPGWQITATNGGGGTIEGEASCSVVARVIANGCYIGGYLTGADSNVQKVEDCTFGNNDLWGLLATQFLSCTFINNHFKTNGQAYTYTYNGGRYAVTPGQESAASTTAPGTNNVIWNFIDNVVNSTFTAWTSGGTYVAGGSVCHNNRNARSVFISNYSESGQTSAQVFYPALSVGGTWAHATGADGVHLQGEQGQLLIRGLTVTYPQSDAIGTFSISPARGFVSTGSGGSLGFGTYGADYRWTDSNSDYAVSARITGAKTARTFGRTAPVPNVFQLPQFVMSNAVWQSGSAIPTTGNYAQNEIIWNNACVAGGNIGWVCVTAGSPGTWKPFGTIGS